MLVSETNVLTPPNMDRQEGEKDGNGAISF